MTAVEYPPHDFYARHNVPHNSSSLTPSTTASVGSDAHSQFSGFFESTTNTPLNDLSKCYQLPDGANARWTQTLCKSSGQSTASEVPRLLRQNPRRTSSTATTRTGCPPTLVRQAERKLNFVDNLVDSSTQIVMAIWPNSSPLCPEAASDSSVLPLRTFIQETLRRSRTSYSTLQVALYYLVLIKDKLPARDFTMEQTDDCHASRALQCGRRMFLAALILASKYLQDRNYSARAWSKISGLNTNEINQNEMAFVIAVNWKLHISEQVYHRWTDCVMKHSPSQPPAPPTPGSLISKREYDVKSDSFSKQCAYFQEIIQLLNPDLENLEEALARSNWSRVPSLSPRSLSPRSVLAAAQDESGGFPFESSDFGSRDATPTPRVLSRTPSIMEPCPSAVPSATRLAPAFGLLPTPRLTPQISAIRDLSPSRTAGSAMSMAVSAAGSVQNAMILDKWPGAITSSPVHYHTQRRPSLATSVSTMSSPESMVSDLSGSSRSSSISSISSLGGAPYIKADHANLEVQARCRSAKQLMNERYVTRPISVEDYAESFTSSPMSYNGSLGQEHLSHTAQAARDCEIDDATNDAAQALQALHNNWQMSRAARKSAMSGPKAGSKRSRPVSIDIGLHENVRGLLRSEYISKPTTTSSDNGMRISAPSHEGRKRVCCSVEAAPYQGPLTGFEGPGMWAGILN